MLGARRREEVVAVVDIGSGSAAVAYVRMRPGIPAVVLAAERSILPLQERSREQTMRGVTSMLQEACAHVQKTYAASAIGMRHGAPSSAHTVVRAPWTRASCGRAESLFAKEELITRDTITKLAHTALEADHEIDRANILETSVIRVELNEYATSRPLSKRAHRISIVTFESDFDPVMRKTITTALERAFPHIPRVLHSGARAFLSVAQEHTQHMGAYVIVDMVSEVTTCMAVRDGAITHHTILSEGVRTIMRRVAGVKGTGEDTLNLMRMVIADSCSGEACDALNAALAHVEPDLVRFFGEAFAAFVGKQRLPDTLILSAHPDIIGWLSNFFARIDFAQFTVTMRPFTVHALSPENLQAVALTEKGVSVDTGMVVACGLVNTQESAL